MRQIAHLPALVCALYVHYMPSQLLKKLLRNLLLIYYSLNGSYLMNIYQQKIQEVY